MTGPSDRQAVEGDIADATAPAGASASSELQLAQWSEPLIGEFKRFSMIHKFAIQEVTTKINILREEFINLHDYNPIEHVNSRLKSVPSVIAKARRLGCGLGIEAIREHVRDVAGVRVTCSFVSDVYQMFDVFTAQSDVTVIDVDDYIANPKPNGYQSLHATVQVPVFLSTGAESVYVEMQFRTVAMDFWASLEHKIYYKYDRAVPDSLLAELKEAADTAASLDQRMQRLHREVASLPHPPAG
ncbi:MAG: GTP pyrophosphokinase family protein [Ilumatobacteraceae bacterium]